MSTISMGNEATVDLLPASEVARLTMERYRERHLMPGITGVPSGWPTIDRDTGGYQGGDLVIWAGRPATGKTWLLLRQARYAAEAGFNVLFVTMEMGLTQIGTRFYGMIAGVNPRLIRDGRLGTRAERRLLATTRGWEASHRLHFYSGNMGQSSSALNAVIVERNPDAVFVDGVYLMRSPNADRGANRNSHVAYVIDDLKRFALARDIPVIGTTQFSREAGRGGRSGSLETIAYTDAVSTHASLIYSIQPAHARAVNQNTILVNTQKGREGEAAGMALRFEFNPVNFDETDLSQALDPRDTDEVDLNWMRE
jgi:replicative DNA helicase